MGTPAGYKLVPTELLERIVERDDAVAFDDDHYSLPDGIRTALDEILAGPSVEPSH